VVYLVRSLGLMPEFVSHDWHVQPSCQRPNRGPPRRREFSPGELAQVRIRLSSKPYKHTVRLISRQSSLPTEFPDDFHIGKSVRGAAAGELPAKTKIPRYARNDKAFVWRSQTRATVWPSVRDKTPLSALHLRQPDTEDKKLRKDPYYLEVLALKVPFGRPYVNRVAFRMKSRGRDD
jgi:hypothetical protein